MPEAASIRPANRHDHTHFVPVCGSPVVPGQARRIARPRHPILGEVHRAKSTFCPCFSLALSIGACQAVKPTRGMEAASSMVSALGLIATSSSLIALFRPTSASALTVRPGLLKGAGVVQSGTARDTGVFL